MDFQSLETLAYLSAQNEMIDMNEEDAQAEMNLEDTQSETHAAQSTQAAAQSTQIPPQPTAASRKRRRTSTVWADFEELEVDEDGKKRAKCLHCGKKLTTHGEKHGSYGTNHMRQHLETCSKKPQKADRPAYDQKKDRKMVAEVIIYHDLPFRYVEYKKVRERDKYLNPECQPICRQTAAADVYRRYELEKENLKVVFERHNARVCFTSDLWTSRCNAIGYICLTAHFIDDSWTLHSKILAFCELKPPHTGEEIANKIFECMMEWGLEKKVFSIAIDNATNNDSMQRILKNQLEMMSSSDSALLCNGKFLHVRCCAHILNLIVKAGLVLANELLHNIRKSVRYVKAPQTRIQAFTACVERVGIKTGAGLSLDVHTRWNSSYEMLARALKFREAFKSLKAFDRNYKTLPSEDEWNRGEKICELLKPFSVISTHFSGSKYPTSCVYFTQVWRIELLLRKFTACDDYDVREMASDMQVKVAKYWEDYIIILAMGAILDPRMKLDMPEKAYETVNPSTSKSKTEELRKNLTALYKEYQNRTWGSSSVATSTQKNPVTESPHDDDDEDLDELERRLGFGDSNTKTHLDMYLDEPRLNRKAFRDLDVLNYWKENQHKFGDLASMARDILSIPITTVASESAFSIGARVLTPYRNRLLPRNLQALLCARNWLHGFAEYEGTIEDINDMCNEDGKNTATSGVGCSRSEDSAMP